MDADLEYKNNLESNCTRMHKSYIEQIQEATSPQNNGCTVTYLPSLKLSKLDEQDILNTTGEVRTNS